MFEFANPASKFDDCATGTSGGGDVRARGGVSRAPCSLEMPAPEQRRVLRPATARKAETRTWQHPFATRSCPTT